MILVISSDSLLEVTKLNIVLDLQLSIRVSHVAVGRLVDRNVCAAKSVFNHVGVGDTMLLSRNRRPCEDVFVVVSTQLVLLRLFRDARLCLCQVLMDVLQ